MRQFLGPSGQKSKTGLRYHTIKAPEKTAEGPKTAPMPTVYYDSEGRPVFSVPPAGQPNVNNPYTIYGNPLPYTPVGGGQQAGTPYNPGVQPGQTASPGKTIYGADSADAPESEDVFTEEFGNRQADRRKDLTDRGGNPAIFVPTAFGENSGPGALNTDNQDDELDYIFG